MTPPERVFMSPNCRVDERKAETPKQDFGGQSFVERG
jgi:hypothetical protein